MFSGTLRIHAITVCSRNKNGRSYKLPHPQSFVANYVNNIPYESCLPIQQAECVAEARKGGQTSRENHENQLPLGPSQKTSLSGDVQLFTSCLNPLWIKSKKKRRKKSALNRICAYHPIRRPSGDAAMRVTSAKSVQFVQYHIDWKCSELNLVSRQCLPYSLHPSSSL